MKARRTPARRGWETWVSILIFVLFLAIWELLERTGSISKLFFPAPTRIAEALVKVIGSGDLLEHLAATLSRLVLGFLLGAIPGLLFGFADSLATRLAILGIRIPSQFLLMTPYIATMVVLAGVVGRGQMPAADGVPYEKEGG